MQTATLSRADIEGHDPEGGRGGRWLCPMPECSEHTDPRRHRSLSLVPETGLWHCHRCHAQGQVKDAWKDFKPKSKRERDAEVFQRRRVGLEKILAKVAKSSADQKSEPITGLKYRFGSLSKLETSRPALAYLSTRGLSSPEALALLTASGVRFAPDFGRREATEEVKDGATKLVPGSRGTASIVFPLRDAQGRLIASQGRFLKPWSSGQKFHTLGDKLAGVFATIGAMDALQKGLPVALVEAPLDACTLALAGVPALALCGCNGLPEWLQRKAFGRQWLIAFDADQAGDASAETVGEVLRSLGGIVSRLRPTEAKDWNEALQTGGEVWDRTAAALLPFLGCEAKAPKEKEPSDAWEGLGKARKSAIPDAEKIPKSPVSSTLETMPTLIRTAWERHFEAVATGRIVYTWPTHDTETGAPYEPVRVTPGVTAEDPARWFTLAFARYCRLWEMVHGGEVEGQAQERGAPCQRLANASLTLEILFSEMVRVLEQGELQEADRAL